MEEALRNAMGKAGEWEPNFEKFEGGKEKRNRYKKATHDNYHKVHGEAFGSKIDTDNFEVYIA